MGIINRMNQAYGRKGEKEHFSGRKVRESIHPQGDKTDGTGRAHIGDRKGGNQRGGWGGSKPVHEEIFHMMQDNLFDLADEGCQNKIRILIRLLMVNSAPTKSRASTSKSTRRRSLALVSRSSRLMMKNSQLCERALPQI